MSYFRSLAVPFVALALFISIAPQAHAALIETQAQAIISVLNSFGADAGTISSVNGALRGQTSGVTATYSSSSSGSVACPQLTVALARGNTDAQTSGQVTKLQQFLTQYFGLTENIVSGYYGATTEKYVKQFQAKNGITQYGSVGPQTRAAIANACENVLSTGPTIAPNGLQELIPGHNIATADRINLVIVGVNFLSSTEFKTAMLEELGWNGTPTYGGSGFGPFAIEPLRSNKHKFNVWYDPNMIMAGTSYLTVVDEINTQIQQKKNVIANSGLPYVVPIFLNKLRSDMNSFIVPHSEGFGIGLTSNSFSSLTKGSLSPTAVVVTLQGQPTEPSQLAHELGHSIFGLADEKTDTPRDAAGTPPVTRAPNCIANKAGAEALWGSMVGQVDPFYSEWKETLKQNGKWDVLFGPSESWWKTMDEGMKVGYYYGKCYGDANGTNVIRPTDFSIMHQSQIAVFGPVNRRQIEIVLGFFSGKTIPSTSTTSPLISSCREITAPGTYTLQNSIATPNGYQNACISIRNTNNVTLDCNKNAIMGGGYGAIKMENVGNFTITRCTLDAPGGPVAYITGGATGKIVDNTIKGSYVAVEKSSDLQISGNTFTAAYQQSHTVRSIISSNTFALDLTRWSGPAAGVISSGFGNGNKIIGNTMDGKAKGLIFEQIGADDGIIAQDEDDLLIQGNTISNVWDCGIENSGTLSNSRIENNKINNIGICGIGGWYWSSWRGNTFANNTVSDTYELFHFVRAYGLRPKGFDGRPETPADSAVYFKDNTFLNNTLLNGRTIYYSATYPDASQMTVKVPPSLSSTVGETMPTPAQIITGNNRFQGNNFGTQLPLIFEPFSMIVDGGGNICKSSGEAGFPLKCSGTTSTSTPTAGITVTAPNGGEQWQLGTLNTITWTPYSYNPDVNPASDVIAWLDQKLPGGGIKTLGKIVPGGKASIHWEGYIIENGTLNTVYAPPGQYYIRVENTKTGASDTSNAVFTLLPRPVDVKINGSDGPLTLSDNQSITVSWVSSNPAFTSCTLEGVRQTPGTGVPPVIWNLPTSGSRTLYAWAPYLGSFTAMTMNCMDSGSTVRGTDVVQINAGGTPGPASLMVVSPNSAELVRLNEPRSIEWTQAGMKSVSIAVYKNDQWLTWLVKDFSTACTSCAYRWTPSGSVFGGGSDEQTAALGKIFKIYITGQKADGTGYIEDKSDVPFGFVSAATSTPVAILTATPASGFLSGTSSPMLRIDFNLTNYTSMGGEIIEFGDGTRAVLGYTTPTNARYEYRTAGTYIVVVKNSAGVSIANTIVVVKPAITAPAGVLTASVDSTYTPANANVIAGSTNVKAGAFKFTAVNSAFTIDKLMVRVPSGETLVGNVRLSYQDSTGVTKTTSGSLAYASGGKFAYAQFSGLGFYIPKDSSRVLSVSVDPLSIAQGATSGVKISVLLDGDEGFSAIDGAGNVDTTLTGSVADLRSDANAGYGTLVPRKSLPTLSSSIASSTLAAGANIPLARVVVSANPAGDIDWGRVTLAVNKTSSISLSAFSLWKSPGNIQVSGSFASTSCAVGSTNCTLVFTPSPAQTVGAGTSATYELRATVAGLASGSNVVTVSIMNPSTSIVNGTMATVISSMTSSFVWSDWSNSTQHATNALTASDWTNDYLIKNLPLNLSSLMYIVSAESRSNTLAGAAAALEGGSGAASCPDLTLTLAPGHTNAVTGGEVTRLQVFLMQYLGIADNIATGYFGPVTESYVKQLQARAGLEQVGYVGPMTRAYITSVCNG